MVVGCPSGFTYVSAVSACYRMGTNRLNWTDAADSCTSFNSNAHLVVINNAEEHAAIASYMILHTGGFGKLCLNIFMLTDHACSLKCSTCSLSVAEKPRDALHKFIVMFVMLVIVDGDNLCLLLPLV